MEKKFLRVADVARMLQVHPCSLRRWLEQGKGPEGLQTPGGLWIFDQAAVERWLAQLQNPQRPPKEPGVRA